MSNDAEVLDISVSGEGNIFHPKSYTGGFDIVSLTGLFPPISFLRLDQTPRLQLDPIPNYVLMSLLRLRIAITTTRSVILYVLFLFGCFLKWRVAVPPISHPKMIILSRKTHWAQLGKPTILRNPHLGIN